MYAQSQYGIRNTKNFMKGLLQNYSAGLKILAFFVVLLFSLTLVLTVSGIVSNGNAADVSNLKILQLIQSVGLYVITPLIFAFLIDRKPFAFLKINRTGRTKSYFWVVLTMCAAIPFINLLGFLNQQVVFPEFLRGLENYFITYEKELADLTEKFLTTSSFNGLIFNLFLIALIPAVGEELLFRGTIQQLIGGKNNQHLAIWITAFIFSAIHFQFYGFLPRFLLGAFLGYLFFWSKSIWLPIVAHFVNNAIVVIFYFLHINKKITLNIDEIGTNTTWYLGLASAAVVVVLLILMRYENKETKY